MCGLNFSFDESKIEEMNSKIKHRGIRSNVRGKLGHTRLPIQGLSTDFDGPYDHGKWRIAFVGEIYNFRDINPNAKSDIEVLADVWDKEGINGFRQFDGMWACVIWDSTNGHYHVITDPLAKKPLYMNEDLDISSEMGPIIDRTTKVEIDPFYYSTVAKWGYCMFDNTPYKAIKKIPAGHHLILHDREVIYSNHYWDLSQEAFNAAFPRESLRKAIEKAVETRMIADVGISILCSGGLDSSIIYQLARKIDPDVHAIHIDNGPDDEDYFKCLDADNYSKYGLLEDDLDQIIVANEGPVDLGSMVPQYSVFNSIRVNQPSGGPVVLSGDGADECFLGYNRAKEYDSRYSDIFSELIYYHLPRLDKLSMFHTLELRSPFLSFDVVRIALGMDYEKSINKQMLRDIFQDIVPKPIIDRPKVALRYKSPRDSDWRYKLIKMHQGLG